jgi:putative transposase
VVSALDQDGIVLDILMQQLRVGQAAKRLFKCLIEKWQYEPRGIVTDRLKSYDVAHRHLLPRLNIDEVGI